MAELTTRMAHAQSGTEAVYSGRAKIGYLVCDAQHGRHHWELTMLSEQMQGHPRGVSESRDQALAQIDSMFTRWCAAAGVTRS